MPGILSRLRSLFQVEDVQDLITRNTGPMVSIGSQFDPVYSLYLGTHPDMMQLEVRAVRSNSAAHGFFYLGSRDLWDLLDEMDERDEVISSCLDLLTGIILQLPREVIVKPGYEGNSKVLECKQRFETDVIKKTNFQDAEHSLIRGVLLHGTSTVEKTWMVEADNYITIDKFVHAHPGQFTYDRDGNAYLLSVGLQAKDAKPWSPLKYMRAVTPTMYSSPWGHSLIIGLRYKYWYKKRAIMSSLQYLDQHGTPIIHASIPSKVTNRGVLAQLLLKKLEKIRKNGFIITTEDETLTVHQRLQSGSGASTGVMIFDGPIDRFDRYFMRKIIGSELTMGTQPNGARALGQVHAETTLQKVAPVTDWVSYAITHGLLEQYCLLNYGPDVADALAYCYTGSRAENIDTIFKALEIADKVGLKVAARDARKKLGFDAIQTGENGEEEPTLPEVERAAPIIVPSAIDPKQQPGDANPNDAPPPNDSGGDNNQEGYAELFNEPLQAEAEFVAASHKLSLIKNPTVALFETNTKKAKQFRADVTTYLRKSNAQIQGFKAKAAKALFTDTKSQIAVMLKQLSEDMHKQFHPDQRMSERARALLDTRNLDVRGAYLHLGYGSFMLANLASYRALQHVRKAEGTHPLHRFATNDLPSGFEDAANWFESRGVMTVAQVQELAQAMADEFGDNVDVWEQRVREQYLALANQGETAVVKKIQGIMVRSIHAGESVGQFLDGLDSEIGNGTTLPAEMNAYWEMVFRTEVGNAYKEQQALAENRPDFQRRLWGHEGVNPNDERSDPTHGRINTVHFKNDSQASRALGRPPFRYSCRCSLVPLMAPDPEKAAYSEPSDAYSIASQVTRFK